MSSMNKLFFILGLLVIATVVYFSYIQFFVEPIISAEKPPIVRDLSCSVDEDCIWAYSTDGCCSCGRIYSKKQADAEPRLRYPEKEVKYNSRPIRCKGVNCEMCWDKPKIICDEGICKADVEYEITRCTEKTGDLEKCQKDISLLLEGFWN